MNKLFWGLMEMLKDTDQKVYQRNDAIYNPIEGKWEKRRIPIKDKSSMVKQRTAMQDESITTKVMNLQLDLNLQSMVKDLKENMHHLTSAPTVESSKKIIKKLMDKPLKKLETIKEEQDQHDRQFFEGTQEEYGEAKKKEDFMIIKVVIAGIALLAAAMSKL